MGPNQKYISLGIQYNEKEFNKVENRKIYDDTDFPPTKPIKGGFWGSSYFEKDEYASQWEKYVYQTLNTEMFSHRLNKPSTIFTIKQDARVLKLASFNDVWIDFENSQSNLLLRTLAVSGSVPINYERHFFLDFESMMKHYDAIYVTQGFAERVDWVLKEFERRILNDEREYDDKLSPADLYIAEIFEDWNVDSILILNNNIINVEETLKIRP